jgi:hypothetical protein
MLESRASAGLLVFTCRPEGLRRETWTMAFVSASNHRSRRGKAKRSSLIS